MTTKPEIWAGGSKFYNARAAFPLFFFDITWFSTSASAEYFNAAPYMPRGSRSGQLPWPGYHSGASLRPFRVQCCCILHVGITETRDASEGWRPQPPVPLTRHRAWWRPRSAPASNKKVMCRYQDASALYLAVAYHRLDLNVSRTWRASILRWLARAVESARPQITSQFDCHAIA